MGLEGLLFDIEGTIVPLSFVSEVLFPAALEALPVYLNDNWSNGNEFSSIKQGFPQAARVSQDAFIRYCRELNANNSKFPPWKTLQGILWRRVYDDGTVKAPLFDDFPAAIDKLPREVVEQLKIYIYSSGSVEAQKLLFKHTNRGNLESLLAGYFDPAYLKVENKFDPTGYQKIIAETGISQWTFFSDNPKEVEGAEQAGMKGYLVIREGNTPLSDEVKAQHKVIEDLWNLSDLI